MEVSRAFRIAVAALSIAALSVLSSAQPGQNGYDPAARKAASRPGDSFLDSTLKRINPAGQDYGKCLDEGRALLLDESLRNGYFWSNLVALSLLGCLLLVIIYQHRLETRRDWTAAQVVAECEQALARSNAQVDQVTQSNHGLNDALAAIREPALGSTLKHQNSAQRSSSTATEDRALRPQPASPPPRATAFKPAIERGANMGVATGSAPLMAPSKLDADIVARINLLEQQLAYAQEENKQFASASPRVTAGGSLISKESPTQEGTGLDRRDERRCLATKGLCANQGRECWTSSSLPANRGQSKTRLSAKSASTNCNCRPTRKNLPSKARAWPTCAGTFPRIRWTSLLTSWTASQACPGCNLENESVNY